MERELNTLLPGMLRAIGFKIQRVPPQDFLRQARAQGAGCTIIETVSISVTDLRRGWDVWDIAAALVMKLSRRVLGNEIIFFDKTPIVKYNISTASVQLLLPQGYRIDCDDTGLY